MSIYVKSLSPNAYDALQALSSSQQWPDLNGWMEPEIVAYLCVRLQFVADTEQTFPGGKWATIQFLQQLVSDFARKETRS